MNAPPEGVEYIVNRASVFAADDMDSHEEVVAFPSDVLIETVIERIVQCGYLAQIGGGHATWIVYSGKPVGVVAQEWARPVFFRPVDPKTIARKEGRIVIDFGYEAQKPPEEVFDALMRETGA